MAPAFRTKLLTACWWPAACSRPALRRSPPRPDLQIEREYARTHNGRAIPTNSEYYLDRMDAGWKWTASAPHAPTAPGPRPWAVRSAGDLQHHRLPLCRMPRAFRGHARITQQITTRPGRGAPGATSPRCLLKNGCPRPLRHRRDRQANATHARLRSYRSRTGWPRFRAAMFTCVAHAQHASCVEGLTVPEARHVGCAKLLATFRPRAVRPRDEPELDPPSELCVPCSSSEAPPLCALTTANARRADQQISNIPASGSRWGYTLAASSGHFFAAPPWYGESASAIRLPTCSSKTGSLPQLCFTCSSVTGAARRTWVPLRQSYLSSVSPTIPALGRYWATTATAPVVYLGLPRALRLTASLRNPETKPGFGRGFHAWVGETPARSRGKALRRSGLASAWPPSLISPPLPSPALRFRHRAAARCVARLLEAVSYHRSRPVGNWAPSSAFAPRRVALGMVGSAPPGAAVARAVGAAEHSKAKISWRVSRDAGWMGGSPGIKARCSASRDGLVQPAIGSSASRSRAILPADAKAPPRPPPSCVRAGLRFLDDVRVLGSIAVSSLLTWLSRLPSGPPGVAFAARQRCAGAFTAASHRLLPRDAARPVLV